MQIISDKNVEDVTLGASSWVATRNSYNSAIKTLNQKAERYAESSPYALDGRCVGSVPTVGTDGSFNAKNTENVGPVELQFTSSVEGANNMKDEDSNYEIDYDTMEALEESGVPNILKTEEWYWLASRYVDDSKSYNCYFYVRAVQKRSGNLSTSNSMCYVFDDDWHNAPYGEGVSTKYGLRPCISLRTDVKVIGGGDGSSEAQAYELGI